MSNPTTRWWWVRHAPVIDMDGIIYGSGDVDCDTSDSDSFDGLAEILPGDAVWLSSHLSRTHRTAEAISAAGLVHPDPMIEEDLGEQDFGDWQGLRWDEMRLKDTDQYEKFWEKAARNRPPGGESFHDLIERVGAVIDRRTHEHSGNDIIAVAHGGTIRAAVSHALNLSPETGMSFSFDTLSVTCLEHIEGGLLEGSGESWRVAYVNRPAK